MKKSRQRCLQHHEYEVGVMCGPTFLCRRAIHCRELDLCRPHRELLGHGPRMRVNGHWLSPVWASRMLWTKAGTRRTRAAQRRVRRQLLEHRVHARSGRYDDLPF